MTQVTADFELGVNGNNVEVADAGSATAWNVVQRSGASTIVYSNAQVIQDSTLSAKYNNTAGSACWTEWAAALGNPTDWYGRIYAYFPTVSPTLTGTFVQCLDAAAVAFQFQIVPVTGLLRVSYNTGNDTLTTAPSTNQWIRVEWHVVHSTTVGQVEVKLFNSPYSSTPTETFTSTANKNTLTEADQIRFGQVATFATGVDIWLDAIVGGASSYPGPGVVSQENLAPVIYGRGAA